MSNQPAYLISSGRAYAISGDEATYVTQERIVNHLFDSPSGVSIILDSTADAATAFAAGYAMANGADVHFLEAQELSRMVFLENRAQFETERKVNTRQAIFSLARKLLSGEAETPAEPDQQRPLRYAPPHVQALKERVTAKRQQRNTQAQMADLNPMP